MHLWRFFNILVSIYHNGSLMAVMDALIELVLLKGLIEGLEFLLKHKVPLLQVEVLGLKIRCVVTARETLAIGDLMQTGATTTRLTSCGNFHCRKLLR